MAEATQQSARAYAKESPTEYLKCRLNQHDMDPYEAQEYRINGLRFFRSVELCGRCHAVYRHREISADGQILESWYSKVPGTEYYNTPGRLSGAARNVLRMEYMRRSFVVKVVKSLAKIPKPHRKTREALGLPDWPHKKTLELLSSEGT